MAHTLGPPDPKYVKLFNLVSSDLAAAYAYNSLAAQDPLSRSYTRDEATNLWRAWQSAQSEFQNGRPLDAFAILEASGKRFPFKTSSDKVAEAERLALVAECLAGGNQLVLAVDYTHFSREVLRRFIKKIAIDPLACTNEVRTMIGVLCSVKFENHSREDGLITAWAVTRGIRLACQLAQLRAELPHLMGSDVNQPAIDLEDDAQLIEQSTGTKFEGRSRTGIAFTLGNILTPTDPQRAFEHFESVADLLGVADGLGLQAAINAANCLLRIGRFEEAENRYSLLESLFESQGDFTGAARVWISECIANWKRLRDPKVVHSLVGAIKMFEKAIPPGTDVMTLYTQKRLVEPAYMALVAAIAHSTDRSDAALDQLLSVVWAMLSRELLARLEPEEKDDRWEKILACVRRPLLALKIALAPLPGLGVVHLISATDCLVWIALGYDKEGQFRVECHSSDRQQSELFAEFVSTMDDQLEADRVGDRLGIVRLQGKLEELGSAIAAQMPATFRDFISSMSALFYMPHSFGNVDEFPLGGLRIDNAWLGESVPIVRSPSINHLRETLAPNRAEVRANQNGVVVLGAADAEGQTLRAARVEADRIRQMLEVIGFNAEVNTEASSKDMTRWLDGEAGALHYVGHGMADEIQEALPLANGEMFGPLNADRLDGFRVPFVFLCACMAARVRGGQGGYQTGIASKLVERGGPGVVAFSMPVTESAAYLLADCFYRSAVEKPLAEAARTTFVASSKTVPLYARLSFTCYGDPNFELQSMVRGERVAMLSQACQTWCSKLRRYCVLRTPESAADFNDAIASAPKKIRTLLRSWMSIAFKRPALVNNELLNAIETTTGVTRDCSDVELLSLRVAVLSELLHQSGIETVPIYIPTDAESIRSLLSYAHFLARVGAALLDARVNGLGNSLMGRIITVDQNDAHQGARFLRQGREKLLECEEQSSFVKSLRADDKRILEHFGLDP